jgi:hypothetical protein
MFLFGQPLGVVGEIKKKISGKEFEFKKTRFP